MIRRLSGVLCILIIVAVSLGYAEIPQVISFQGKVTDTGGVPVPDGDYDMEFRIYDAQTGGNEEWNSGGSPVSVSVTDGVFDVLLGESNAIELEFDEDYWLEVEIEGDVQSPRTRMGSTGYAYLASGLVPGTEIIGPVRTGSRAAISAINTAEDGYGISGGYFECLDDGGYGVYGSGSSSWPPGSGVSGGGYYGIWGSCSMGGVGVKGLDSYTDGFSVGVSGVSHSTEGGRGVLGIGYGDGYGVYSAGNFAASGSKSCVVKTSRGPSLMYCQESPENWFEDFGEGQLVNGRCHIELDPLYLETVTIDDENPMKVFVQLKGDCFGVYVDNALTSFDVIERQGGSSSVPFTYRVVAKRKGFEEKRLDYCRAAESDPYLYEEIREKMIREDLEERARFEEARKEYGMKRGSDPESFSRSE